MSALDLSEPDSAIYNLLTEHGGLPGAEVTKQQADGADKVAESVLQEDQAEEAAAELAEVSLAGDEALSVPSVRPTTPSRRSFVADPVFESDQPDYAAVTSSHPSRAPTPATPPPAPEEVVRQGPGILKKMFSMMKKKSSQMPQDSILSSVVGFYAAQMTLLAAAIIGIARVGVLIPPLLPLVCPLIWTSPSFPPPSILPSSFHSSILRSSHSISPPPPSMGRCHTHLSEK